MVEEKHEEAGIPPPPPPPGKIGLRHNRARTSEQTEGEMVG